MTSQPLVPEHGMPGVLGAEHLAPESAARIGPNGWQCPVCMIAFTPCPEPVRCPDGHDLLPPPK